jgi:multisubunit Na+/H+ antiporter MnhB subunit
MEQVMSSDEEKKPQNQNDRLIGGTIVLGIGLIFLLINLGVLPEFSETWPLILVIIGVALIAGGLFKRKT